MAGVPSVSLGVVGTAMRMVVLESHADDWEGVPLLSSQAELLVVGIGVAFAAAGLLYYGAPRFSYRLEVSRSGTNPDELDPAVHARGIRKKKRLGYNLLRLGLVVLVFGLVV